MYKNNYKINKYFELRNDLSKFTIYSDLLEFIFINIFLIIININFKIFINNKLNTSNLAFLNDIYKNSYINNTYKIDFYNFIENLIKWLTYWLKELNNNGKNLIKNIKLNNNNLGNL